MNPHVVQRLVAVDIVFWRDAFPSVCIFISEIHTMSRVALFSNEMAKKLLAPLSGLFLDAGKFGRERIMLDYSPVLLTMGSQRALIPALTSVWVLPRSAGQGKPDDHRRVEEEKR